MTYVPGLHTFLRPLLLYRVEGLAGVEGYQDVYVIADCAWAYDSSTNAPVPATAQAGRQQGYYVGKAIAREYANRLALPYRCTPLGHLALLDHYTAVAEVGPIAFRGLPAWVFWHLVYLQRNPSWSKRIQWVVDWLLSSIPDRETGQLRLGTGLPQRRSAPRWAQ